MSLIDQIDALLPQTQCQRCDYDGCRPYAEAISKGDAINKCPPGGEQTITALALLLGREPLALDVARGEPGPRQLAVIREHECIGCTKCIQVCPTDAILGASRQMHSVIESECSGCELCLPACPVDCIDMVTPAGARPISQAQSAHWRQRHQQRQQRLQLLAQQRLQRRQARQAGSAAPQPKSRSALQRDILAAVARVKAKREQSN